MTVLLDANALLFALLAPERLSARARSLLEDRGCGLVWSAASTWEVMLKSGTGRLDLGGEPAAVLSEQLLAFGVRHLPIEQAHALRVATLPDPATVGGPGGRHADPFDRMLVAQAKMHNLVLVSHDPKVLAYDVASLDV